MTGRERIQIALAHREPPLVPLDIMFAPPALAALQAYLGTEDVDRALGVDIAVIGPSGGKPLYASPALYGPTITDEWGVVWTTSDIDRGSPIGPSVPEPDLALVRRPDPNDPRRFAGMVEALERETERHRSIAVADMWERAGFMRGLGNLLLDVAIRPDFVAGLLDILCDYMLATIENVRAMPGESLFLSDDYGMQHGLMISPEDWRRLVRPRFQKFVQASHAAGKAALLHSCGAITPLVPQFIECGLDILHPIQPEAMDIFALKREFGHDLTFCGGISTQQLLPRGTPQQIREEVNRLADCMGQGGGYILEPGITLQADIPTENLVAVIQAAQEYRRSG
jgi:uroporphyrinogen decarboxylase